MHRLIKATCMIAAEDIGKARAERIAAKAQKRYEELCRENTADSKTLRAHTYARIYPAIAVYEALRADGVGQENAFQNARVYLGEREENYLTNTWHCKQIGPLGLKNSVTIAEGYQLLKDGQTVQIGDFKVQAFLVPGHTLGHLCYLIQDEIL